MIGIVSYLLINFWFTRIQANKAAILALTMNRVGALWSGISLLCLKLSNSGDILKLLVPNYIRKAISGWTNYSCMVISQKINEKKMGYRGSKLNNTLFEKEQRADGSYCIFSFFRSMQLRCALMGFERNYQIKILSKQLNKNKRNFSTLVQNTKFNPWFISGFSDADSSFSINTRKNLTYKVGWQITGRFRIELHNKDLELLKSIQLFFNEIGQVGIVETIWEKKTAYFEVTKLNDLVNIIIPHFDKYSLQSAKSIDYQVWKKCIYLMVNKEHLTQSGLENIISIKANLNWGNSQQLMNSFPNVIPIARPTYKISEEPLNPYWLSGFSEGESSFYVSIIYKRNEVQAGFAIRLNERDKPLLIKIQYFFNGIGNIYDQSSNNASLLQISKRKDLTKIIIPHFNFYKLAGNKKTNFLIWSQILSLINKKAHLSSEGFEKIKHLKDQLNKWD